jgi:hypothetical protein
MTLTFWSASSSFTCSLPSRLWRRRRQRHAGQGYRGRLPDSNYLHFGFEENERACLCKAYLEFYDKVEETMKTQPGKSDSFLMHLGFKWDALDNRRQTITRYSWHPFLPVEAMLGRLSNVLAPDGSGALFEITRGIVEIALRVVPPFDRLLPGPILAGVQGKRRGATISLPVTR